MPAWNTYKKLAEERGSLALELFIVESSPIADEEALKAVLPEHLEYQRTLEDAGNLFLAGPLSDDSGELMQGSGMIVYRCRSFEQAQELANKDPMHAKKIRSYQLRKWLVNEGSLNLSAQLSIQNVKLS